MAHVRHHGTAARTDYADTVYEWPDERVLEVPDDVAEAMCRDLLEVTMAEAPRIHHETPGRRKSKTEGKAEDDAQDGDA